MVVRETQAMISGMRPELIDGCFAFCTTTSLEQVSGHLSEALCLFRESEGLSLVMPIATAEALGFDCASPMRWIRLNVFSALDGVGLTAAVAGALSERAIPCNVIAAFHHDHIFVPACQADEALKILQALSEKL